MNVIFDIGKVLIDFEFEKYVHELFEPETAEKVIAATWHNPEWNELDKGVLSDEEVLQLFIAKAPECEKEIRIAFAGMGTCPKMRSTTIPMIKKLKKAGYGVYYLSNYFEYLMHTAPWALFFKEYMEGGLFSCHVKVTKPDLRIFGLLCEKYGLVPSECVFIDDTLKNVAAAEKFGMHGIHFTGQSTKELISQINECFR